MEAKSILQNQFYSIGIKHVKINYASLESMLASPKVKPNIHEVIVDEWRKKLIDAITEFQKISPRKIFLML
jgi:hypothetical protein